MHIWYIAQKMFNVEKSHLILLWTRVCIWLCCRLLLLLVFFRHRYIKLLIFQMIEIQAKSIERKNRWKSTTRHIHKKKKETAWVIFDKRGKGRREKFVIESKATLCCLCLYFLLCYYSLIFLRFSKLLVTLWQYNSPDLEDKGVRGVGKKNKKKRRRKMKNFELAKRIFWLVTDFPHNCKSRALMSYRFWLVKNAHTFAQHNVAENMEKVFEVLTRYDEITDRNPYRSHREALLR